MTIVTLAGYGTCLRQIPRAKIGSSTHPRAKHNHGMDSSVASAFYARRRCCHFHPLRWVEGAYLTTQPSAPVLHSERAGFGQGLRNTAGRPGLGIDCARRAVPQW